MQPFVEPPPSFPSVWLCARFVHWWSRYGWGTSPAPVGELASLLAHLFPAFPFPGRTNVALPQTLSMWQVGGHLVRCTPRPAVHRHVQHPRGHGGRQEPWQRRQPVGCGRPQPRAPAVQPLRLHLPAAGEWGGWGRPLHGLPLHFKSAPLQQLRGASLAEQPCLLNCPTNASEAV